MIALLAIRQFESAKGIKGPHGPASPNLKGQRTWAMKFRLKRQQYSRLPYMRARKKNPTSSIPYAGASSGQNAQAETKKILQRLGCAEVGFMDKYETHELLLHFKHRGRTVQLTASAKGWAQMYLKQHPYNGYRRRSRIDYEQDALRQGHIAVNSILRDWVKGQVSAIETGVLSFEAVFMPFMLTSDGRPMIERVQELLPKADQKVVSLPSSAA